MAGNLSSLIDSTDATISNTLDRARIEQLPQNGRSLTNIVTMTTPGLISGQGGIQSNGLNSAAFEFVQDGAVLANRDAGGVNHRLPGLDSIQEVSLQTSNSSAKFNRPSTGVISNKSGTNALHGSLFETNRNNAFGLARKREDNYLKPPQLNRNEFGASIGGPVIIPYAGKQGPALYNGKDKTFFFVGWEALYLRQSTTAAYKVPTAAMREGDFSGLINGNGQRIVLYDPLTTSAASPWTRQPFANNQIPLSRESPLAKALYAVTPMPTLNVNPLVASNWLGLAPNNDTEKTLTARIDHHFSEKDQAFFRFSRGTVSSNYLGSAKYGAPTTNDEANVTYAPVTTINGSLSWTHTFSPSFFSETVLSNTYEKTAVLTGPNPNVNYASQLGLPNNFGLDGFPNILGLSFSSWGQGDTTRESSTNITNLDENLTLLRGRHQLTFGGRYRHERLHIFPDQQPPASQVNFSNLATAVVDPSSGSAYSPLNLTGNADASFFLGNANSYTVTQNMGWYRFRDQEIASYLQDDWKVTSRLTLNLGLRWEIHPALHEDHNVLTGYDQKNNAIVLGENISTLYNLGLTSSSIVNNLSRIGVAFETPQQAGAPGGLISNNFFDFAPRTGFAYQLFQGKHATVIRGGYGIYIYPPPPRNFYADTRFNPPFTAGFTQNYTSAAQSPDGLPNYLLRSSPSVVAGQNSASVVDVNSPNIINPGISVYAFTNNYPSTFVHQWNFTLEQKLTDDLVLRASYLGNHGTNLEQYTNINAAPSAYVWYQTTGSPLPTGQYANTATRPVNQTTYGDISIQGKTGWSNNNSIQLNLQRLYSHGYGYQFYWAMSNAFRAGGNGWRDDISLPASSFLPGTVPTGSQALNRFENYARDTTIPKNQIGWNWIADLPFGRGRHFLSNSNRWLDAIVGGWQFAGNGSLSSQWWQPYSSTTPLWEQGQLRTSGTNVKIQDCTSGQCFPGYLWANGYISPNRINSSQNGIPNGVEGVPANYSAAVGPVVPFPANGGNPSDPNYPYYGTNNVLVSLSNGQQVHTAYNPGWNPLTKVDLLGPYNWTMDSSLFKTFQVTERASLRFNADFFNVFNMPGLNNPSSTSGIVSLQYSHNAPRQLQLTLRLSW